MKRSGRPQVAVVYHFYPHYRRAIVEGLAKSKVADFTFWGDDHEYLFSLEAAKLSEGVRFVLAPTHHVGGPFMWQWGAVRAAVDSRYDTVIFHAVPHWPCTWIGALLARALGKRVFFWGHGYLFKPRGLKGLIRRAFYALPHAHLFYGRRSKQFAMDAGWPPEQLHVIYNCQDLQEQVAARATVTPEVRKSVRRELFGDEKRPVIVCPTRLIPMRRLDLLLEAAAELKRRGREVNVIIIGDGPERAKLEALAASLGVRVHFEGACYDETRLARLIMSANVNVAPGKVGLSVNHSLVYGVPVVSHDDGDDQGPEWEAIIPGVTGSYYKKGSVASLVDAIIPWLASEYPTPQTQKACHAIIDRFWNADYQQRAIERAVCGADADDLWDVREVLHEPPSGGRCSF